MEQPKFHQLKGFFVTYPHGLQQVVGIFILFPAIFSVV